MRRIPWILITVTWATISWIASIVLSYNSVSEIYFLVIFGILTTLVWAYIQYKESETIKVKLDFKKDNHYKNYKTEIPFSIHKKLHPIIAIQYENGASGTWDCMLGPEEIRDDWTIIFAINELPSKDLYCLIR